MITKKSSGNGSTSGHGMQSFTVEYLMDCEVYYEYKKGHVISCNHCGEEFHLHPDHNMSEALEVSKTLKSDGCPYCNYRKGINLEHLQWVIASKFQQVEFDINSNRLIQAYRKPAGWKPLSLKQLREALEDKEAA